MKKLYLLIAILSCSMSHVMHSAHLAKKALCGALVAGIACTSHSKGIPTALAAEKRARTFAQWAKACDEYEISPKQYSTPLAKEELTTLIKQFNKKEGNRLEQKTWIQPDAFDQFSDSTPNFSSHAFQPFVQKLAVKKGAQIALHGDLHGDVHSLNGFLRHLTKQNKLGGPDGFTIVDDNFRMIFLGDYTDRGLYGAECVYTILRLKEANPEKVFLVRGNHEDCQLNKHYGFLNELMAKFNYSKQEFDDINLMYNRLPVALFLGSEETNEYVLCCHGGLEPGHDELPHLFEQSSSEQEAYMRMNNIVDYKALPGNRACNFKALQAAANAQGHKTYIAQPFDCGYMWSDFMVRPSEGGCDTKYNPNRGWRFGQRATQAILQEQVKGVIRAHQHGDPEMMASITNQDGKSPIGDTGISKIWRPENCDLEGAVWPNMVATLAAAPDAGYGNTWGYHYDAFAILDVNGPYEDWKLRAVRINPADGTEL